MDPFFTTNKLLLKINGLEMKSPEIFSIFKISPSETSTTIILPLLLDMYSCEDPITNPVGKIFSLSLFLNTLYKSLILIMFPFCFSITYKKPLFEIVKIKSPLNIGII